jgi:phage tail protein X
MNTLGSHAISPPPTPTPTPSTSAAVTNTIDTTGKRIYVSTQGDVWDVIAIKVYGFKRGNESLMYRLLEENYPLRNVSVFPAGLAVVVPEVAVETEIPLVPWKSATLLPTS